MLKEDIENIKKDDSSVEDIKLIIDETNRCKSIVSNLLNFARQGKLEVKNVNIIKIVRDVIKSIKLNPIYNNINIKFNSNLSLENFKIDPDQIKQVLVNIVNNACESLEDSQIKEVNINIHDDDNFLIIDISDTGCGIDDTNIKKLFEPFFTTKKIGKGTGLGLAISYGIIKMHRGNIFVKSKINEGTTFIVKLPINHEFKNDFSKENSEWN